MLQESPVLYAGDLVSHPTDGRFYIEAVSDPAPLYPSGRAKRIEGCWYAAHTLTPDPFAWRCGTPVELGQMTDRGVVTEINPLRHMVALNKGKLIWPIALLQFR